MAGIRQFDEEQVLETALDLFWRRGLSATSMPDLAKATGVQRGSLYHAYGDKERLFLLAFERYADRFLDAAASALDQPDPRRGLTAFFAAAIANMTSGSPSRGCLTTRTATETGRIGRAVAQRLRQLLDALEAEVAAALSKPAARRALALPPNAAARLVITFTRGLAVMERVHGDRRRLRRDAAALVGLLVPPPPR